VPLNGPVVSLAAAGVIREICREYGMSAAVEADAIRLLAGALSLESSRGLHRGCGLGLALYMSNTLHGMHVSRAPKPSARELVLRAGGVESGCLEWAMLGRRA